MAPAAKNLVHFGLVAREHFFHEPDQDAPNIAAMLCSRPVSIVERNGMDLISGEFLMPHALGAAKPWSNDFIHEALRGFPPTSADKEGMAFIRSTAASSTRSAK